MSDRGVCLRLIKELSGLFYKRKFWVFNNIVFYSWYVEGSFTKLGMYWSLIFKK